MERKTFGRAVPLGSGGTRLFQISRIAFERAGLSEPLEHMLTFVLAALKQFEIADRIVIPVIIRMMNVEAIWDRAVMV